jgi:hypothetical protein
MSGFRNDICYAKNIDLSAADNQVVRENHGLFTDGQVWIGTTALNVGGTHINVGTITSSTLTIGYSSPDITIDISGGTPITTINGDTGTISGATTTIYANQTANGCGSSVRFTNSGTVSTLGLTDGLNNTVLGNLSGNATISGGNNAACGFMVLTSLTSGDSNVGMGSTSLNAMQSGSNNIAIGTIAIQNATSGDGNVAIGAQSLQNIDSGNSNVAIGTASGQSLTTNDSNNVLISNLGSAGLNNTIMVGTTGTHSVCKIAGINGVTVTGTAVICAADGQLGTIVSSERYKENIEDMPNEISILALRPTQFNYKGFSGTEYGLIAEEVERDFPYLCFYNENNEPESVKYHQLCTFLLHEVKKLEIRLSELEKK